MKNLDRRIIFVLVLICVGLPLIFGVAIKPVRMEAAEQLYKLVGNLPVEPGKVAFVGADFGPNSKAENATQTEVVVEHLMRRRIPILMFSVYALAEPFLESIPKRVAERLMLEDPQASLSYGKDWVNLGYRPGSFILIRGISSSKNLAEFFEVDARGNKLSDLPIFEKVAGFESISLLTEFTGLTGVFDTYVQFFQSKEHKPRVGHGCTSITIPEAFNYRDSGQLHGLLEGISGAAWYSELLNKEYSKRVPDEAALINTSLGVAHLVIIGLIILGNLGVFLGDRK